MLSHNKVMLTRHVSSMLPPSVPLGFLRKERVAAQLAKRQVWQTSQQPVCPSSNGQSFCTAVVQAQYVTSLRVVHHQSLASLAFEIECILCYRRSQLECRHWHLATGTKTAVRDREIALPVSVIELLPAKRRVEAGRPGKAILGVLKCPFYDERRVECIVGGLIARWYASCHGADLCQLLRCLLCCGADAQPWWQRSRGRHARLASATGVNARPGCSRASTGRRWAQAEESAAAIVCSSCWRSIAQPTACALASLAAEDSKQEGD